MITKAKIKEICQETIKLATQSRQSSTFGSPQVGTILTDLDGKVLAKYYKGEDGSKFHCERTIIEKAAKLNIDFRETILFTTMEPFHDPSTKHTCNVRTIVDAKIKCVYIGMYSQNQQACRAGERYLRHAGIDVYLYPVELSKVLSNINKDVIQSQNSSLLAKDSRFISHKIPEIMVKYLSSKSVTYIDKLPTSWDYTFSNIVSFCRQKGACIKGSQESLEEILYEALGAAYDEKYYNATYCDDVRGKYRQWIDEYKKILDRLRIDKKISQLEVIVVGIGNGREACELYQGYEKIAIVDIAPRSLDKAASILKNAKKYCFPAQDLKDIKSGFYDVYVSLMTFQSTYFDIDMAISEMFRILKNNGVVIISVACGFIKDKNTYIDGLVDPKTQIVDRFRPYELVNKIVKKLIALEFMSIGITSCPSEIFISAIKRF